MGMGFFDLNIPYHESDRHVTDKSSLKSRRLQVALMELGYTGIAYNHILKGVISESDRCSIPPFPLSSLLKLMPSSSALSAAVKFHRDLLNVTMSAPFRQYTRLTVFVDTSSQALALNTGNPILRSYDITAVKPLNQNAFDQACQTSEVDIIAIDFSEKLPFRLKQPMVKTAIKRGVYFEITYSGLIGDAQSRRQMISNSKLLVEWTRGKNLIFSSATTSATELRGPQDVSNLFSLLGLPLEHAKAAISKNCRSLLDNALRKKQFYKEAVKVEEIPSWRQVNPGWSTFDEWLNWDSISSGGGDLILDDIEKSFFLSNITKKTVKAIDFITTTNGLPAHGLLIKDLISGNKAAPEPPDTGNAVEIGETAATCEKTEEQSRLYSKPEEQDSVPETKDGRNTVTEKHWGIIVLPECEASLGCVPKELASITPPNEEGQTSLNDENFCYQASCFEDSEMSSMPIDTDSYDIFSKFEKTELILSEELNYTNGMEAIVVASETRLQDRQSETRGGSVLPDGERVHNITMKAERIPIADNHASIELFSPSNTSNFSASQLKESKIENSCDVGIYTKEGVAVDRVLNKTDSESERGQSLASSDATSLDIYTEGQQYKKMTDSSVASGNKLSINGSFILATNFDEPVSEIVMGELMQIDSDTRYHSLGKLRAGGERRKRNSSHQPFLFSFKRFWLPSHFKRKARKLKPITT